MLGNIINKIKVKIRRRYRISFSKSGDDLQLYKLIGRVKPGAYVDIGCWKPIESSNSYFFHLRNWKGICVDPNPDLKALYKKHRPTDTFVNAALGDNSTESLTYYRLKEPYTSMNSFDANFIKERNLELHIKDQIRVPIVSLEKILDEHLKEDDILDFFDIDTEGFDLQIIKSNNWKKYRPKVIVVESEQNISKDLKSDVHEYLEEVNYVLVGKTVIASDLGNLYYLDKKYYKPNSQ